MSACPTGQLPRVRPSIEAERAGEREADLLASNTVGVGVDVDDEVRLVCHTFAGDAVDLSNFFPSGFSPLSKRSSKRIALLVEFIVGYAATSEGVRGVRATEASFGLELVPRRRKKPYTRLRTGTGTYAYCLAYRRTT